MQAKSTDLYVYHGQEIMRATSEGYVYRPAIRMGPSGQWRITGAVERNNFGHVVRVYTWDELQAATNTIPWTWKNGAQRTYVRDLDHGTIREWRSPRHSLRKVG